MSCALKSAIKLELFARRHHHTSPYRVHGIAYNTRDHCDTIADNKGDENVTKVLMRHLLFNSCIEAEVHASVNHHEETCDQKSSIETSGAVRVVGLTHAVKNTFKLSDLPQFSHMDIVGESGSGVV